MTRQNSHPSSFVRCGRGALVGVALSLGLAACASSGADTAQPAQYQEKQVDELYNVAVDKLKERRFLEAANAFDEVERQHPYSVWATRAQIMGAYSRYQGNDYSGAVASLNRFIQLHPTNRDVAYAYYLRGLSHYEQIVDVARDQDTTQKSLSSLTEVVTRFPNSKYARDAKFKLDLTRDHLAGKEMEIGRFYHNQGKYLAAINRFKMVLDQFQTTTHVPEALHRLTEAYLALGLTDEAKKTASVLGHNFPGSEWYLDSYSLLTGETKEEVVARVLGTGGTAEEGRALAEPPLQKVSVKTDAKPATENAGLAENDEERWYDSLKFW